MNLEIIKLSVLICLAGVLCKVYDDFNDNDLFETEFLKKKKEYINEFLKGMHYILLTYVSSFYIYPVVFITIMNTLLLVLDRDAFTPYETSGTYCYVLFTIFLLFTKYSQLCGIYKYIIMSLLVSVVGAYIMDNIFCKHIEFGYKKLFIRAFIIIIITPVLILNNYFHFFPDDLILCIWYIFGYMLTSCIFQIFLIMKSNNNIETTKAQIEPKEKNETKEDTEKN